MALSTRELWQQLERWFFPRTESEGVRGQGWGTHFTSRGDKLRRRHRARTGSNGMKIPRERSSSEGTEGFRSCRGTGGSADRGAVG